MHKFSSMLLAAVLLAGSACSKKEVEVSSVARTEAAHLASEAQLQQRLRDYAEAEKSLARAVELDPNVAVYWSGLGVNRAMQGNKSGAKKAYVRELEIYEEAVDKDANDISAHLAQIRPLVLLGRSKDARKLLEKLAKKHPEEARVRQFIDGKIIDQMEADPKIREAMVN